MSNKYKINDSDISEKVLKLPDEVLNNDTLCTKIGGDVSVSLSNYGYTGDGSDGKANLYWNSNFLKELGIAHGNIDEYTYIDLDDNNKKKSVPLCTFGEDIAPKLGIPKLKFSDIDDTVLLKNYDVKSTANKEDKWNSFCEYYYTFLPIIPMTVSSDTKKLPLVGERGLFSYESEKNKGKRELTKDNFQYVPQALILKVLADSHLQVGLYYKNESWSTYTNFSAPDVRSLFKDNTNNSSTSSWPSSWRVDWYDLESPIVYFMLQGAGGGGAGSSGHWWLGSSVNDGGAGGGGGAFVTGLINLLDKSNEDKNVVYILEAGFPGTPANTDNQVIWPNDDEKGSDGGDSVIYKLHYDTDSEKVYLKWVYGASGGQGGQGSGREDFRQGTGGSVWTCPSINLDPDSIKNKGIISLDKDTFTKKFVNTNYVNSISGSPVDPYSNREHDGSIKILDVINGCKGNKPGGTTFHWGEVHKPEENSECSLPEETIITFDTIYNEGLRCAREITRTESYSGDTVKLGKGEIHDTTRQIYTLSSYGGGGGASVCSGRGKALNEWAVLQGFGYGGSGSTADYGTSYPGRYGGGGVVAIIDTYIDTDNDE